MGLSGPSRSFGVILFQRLDDREVFGRIRLEPVGKARDLEKPRRDRKLAMMSPRTSLPQWR